jgi:acetylornithine deacetylase/succinyl-diaminopimelate desuccinylase-like protein
MRVPPSGETWGRGPAHDVHSSLEAQVDSPTWHLVQALNTLVEKDGHTPAVEGFFDKAKPLSAAQEKLIRDYAAKTPEASKMAALGVKHWIHDTNWVDSLMLLESKPTINIEGLVAGYTGPGGKTVLPHKAVAKIDMRLVPDMTAADTLAKLKAHLSKHGFADIEVNTGAPLNLPAGHFGLGHGTGAHAPDEYYLIDSTNPKVQGLDGAIASFVDFLYALA